MCRSYTSIQRSIDGTWIVNTDFGNAKIRFYPKGKNDPKRWNETVAGNKRKKPMLIGWSLIQYRLGNCLKRSINCVNIRLNSLCEVTKWTLNNRFADYAIFILKLLWVSQSIVVLHNSDKTLCLRTSWNRDVSIGPLACLRAHSLATLAHSLAPHCSHRSRRLLRSYIPSLVCSLVPELMSMK